MSKDRTSRADEIRPYVRLNFRIRKLDDAVPTNASFPKNGVDLDTKFWALESDLPVQDKKAKISEFSDTFQVN